jgi:1-deoxy-D-xylulose-5-phosphate reductoisomerase
MTYMKQRVAILGSTGSIGTSTLDVISRHSEKFEVFALTAATKVDLLLSQCVKFHPSFAVMVSPSHGKVLQDKLNQLNLKTVVLTGADALVTVAAHDLVDTVMAAIVGAAGLASCLAAANAGKKLLLANKEALVVGGDVFLNAVKSGGATLLPIDSEHSAIFQSLPADQSTWSRRVDKIILTASGGPFRTRDPKTLRDVTPEQACAHPNWVMGRKISVDSATMMNKALEVIEAKFLFQIVPQKLEVVIHPQSVIHSMVQYKDNSVVAQLGTPDMRVPIAYGLSWPERMESGAEALNFKAMSDMTFESFEVNSHSNRFPGLQLAWLALEAPPGTTAVLNAANEIAVDAFLNRLIRFDQIHEVNLQTLEECVPQRPEKLEDLLEIDQRSRMTAKRIAQAIAK